MNEFTLEELQILQHTVKELQKTPQVRKCSSALSVLRCIEEKIKIKIEEVKK